MELAKDEIEKRAPPNAPIRARNGNASKPKNSKLKPQLGAISWTAGSWNTANTPNDNNANAIPNNPRGRAKP